MTTPLDAFRDATESRADDATRVVAAARARATRTVPTALLPRTFALLAALSGAMAWAAGWVPGVASPWPRAAEAPPADTPGPRVQRAHSAPQPEAAEPEAAEPDAAAASPAGSAHPPSRSSRVAAPQHAPLTGPEAPAAAVPFTGPVDLAVATGGRMRGDATGELSMDAASLASGSVTVEGALVVRTREAEVHPGVGPTIVTRDVRGTTVQGGAAHVRCLGANTHEGDRQVCLPVSAEGLLARAGALRRVGDHAGEAHALTLAIEAAATAMVRAEALYLRGVLPGVDPARAVTDLEAALATGASARPDDLSRALARHYMLDRRCEAALPHLRSLEARGTLREDAGLLERCARTER
jgi:hypothetical protein